MNNHTEIRSEPPEEAKGKVLGNNSLLFPLPIIGKQSVLVESLPSYINRLSSAHYLSTNAIGSIIFGNLTGHYKTRQPSNLWHKARAGRLIYATKLSADIIYSLEQLTGRTDLNQCLAPQLHDLVELRCHARANWSWCPLCLGNFIRDGKSVYFPWIWCLDTYTICVEHMVPMLQACPGCAQTWPMMHVKGWSTICRHCGYSQVESCTKNISDFDQWQLLGSKQTYDLIEWATTQRAIASNNFSKNIQSAIANADSVSALARRTKTEHRTIRNWKAGSQMPRLASGIRFAAAFGLKIRDLFETHLDWSETLLQPGPLLRDLYPVRHRPLSELKAALEFAISDVCTEPPSLDSLGARHDCDNRTMQLRFPELLRSLSKKRQAFLEKSGEEQRRKNNERLDLLLCELHVEGQKLTTYHLRKLIERRGEAGAFAMTRLLNERIRAGQIKSA